MGFPTPEQEKVINHTGKPMVVVAAPGTGKTRTIVTRMIKLLKEEPNRNVSFITFTRSSRKDTDKKVKGEVEEVILKNANFDFPRICTLHTYAKSIVHKYAPLIGRTRHFSVLLTEKKQHYLLLSELIDDLNLSIAVDRLFSDISCFRCAGYFPSDSPIPADKRNEVLDYYVRLLRFYNTFDMEGLVESACEILLKENIDFPHVLLQVDEYQDLNPKDQELVGLASVTQGSQVVVVGDDAQSIYQFRHANFKGIQDLWQSDKWDKVCFPDCHRLPSHILRAAQALIAGENYLGGKVNLPSDNGNRILTLQCTTSDIQVEAVAGLIKKIMQKETDRNGQPLTYNNIMILCPTSSFVDKACSVLETSFSIPTKKRCKPVISGEYWRLVLVFRLLHSEDSLALREWLSIAGIAQALISKIRREAFNSGESLYDYCNKLPEPIIKNIFDYLVAVKQSMTDLSSFKRALKDFPALQIEEAVFTKIPFDNWDIQNQNYLGSIIQFIYEKFGLLDEQDENTADIEEEDRVLVTTMYSAKGLEAEFVFIMWLNDKIIPMIGRDVKEQLRVLYVGMTRAKQNVIFTFHEKFDGDKRVKHEAMSPFLQKIISFLEVRRILKSSL